jgi:hypothetical protein
VIKCVVTLALVLAAVACGSGDETLHLRGGDISRADYRDHVRELLLLPIFRDICDSIQGLSTEEVYETLRSEGDDPGGVDHPGFKPVPDQQAERDSGLAAAGIVRDECRRITEES